MQRLHDALADLPAWTIAGRVHAARASALHCAGLGGLVAVGDSCRIARGGGRAPLLAEVAAFDGDTTVLLPYGACRDVALGARVEVMPSLATVSPGANWLGRVLDPLARPLDDRPAPTPGGRAVALYGGPPDATRRHPLGERLPLGVRALDLFVPVRRGQRLGIFAGSGVGKSTLLAMIAKRARADCLVIGLVGERGREVNEFLNETLDAEARARAVTVVATSDQPAMLRRRAAWLALTIAEALRDQGRSVICLVDSLTRFATALREVYLAAGEPPATRGYPPSVFAELPRLLERAGPGVDDGGDVTGLFTVLTEGDDTEEPVADQIRSILDGHVVLDRRIAEAGRYPPVDVLKSLSRTAGAVYAADEAELARHARRLMQAHAESADLIRLGAYAAGADPLVDEAVARLPALEALLAEAPGDDADATPFARLAEALGRAAPATAA
ncbi:MAG: FliI/YscN family ATPase [Alphaproteobacteria bacterium]